MGFTKNMGTNTAKFNQGIIVSGSVIGAPTTDDTIIASGTIQIITPTDPQLKISYDASNYTDFTVDSSGDLTITPSAATGDKNIYLKGDVIVRDNDESKHIVQIYDSSDDGVIAGYANNSITTLIHANGVTYFNGGNVAIGDTSAEYELDVDGDINASDNLYVSGNLYVVDAAGLYTDKIRRRSGQDNTTKILLNNDHLELHAGHSSNEIVGIGDNNNVGTDNNFWVSGSIGSKDSSTRGTAAFGGDVVISGSLYVSEPSVGRDVIFYGEDSSAQGFLWDADYAEHGALILGQNNHGVDFIAYGETASRYIYWDQSNDRFNTAGGMMHTNGDVSFNDGGGSYDFRVESVANANMLFVDGGNSNVGIGTSSPNSVLHVNGPIAKPIVTKTEAYTLTDSDSTILIDASGGVVTVTLPAASGLSGRIYTIKCIDSTSSATIASDGTELIDGSSSNISLSQWDSYTLQCNGTSWFKIGYVQGPPP